MFRMNTLDDYHDLYLKTDVSLFADIFEKFIGTCLEYSGLDPSHYVSSPELNWVAMLRNDWNILRTHLRHWHVSICWKKNHRRYFDIAKRHSIANKKIHAILWWQKTK